ncbi:MAG: extracellular solute-binding protein [Bacilli bacterium]|nr:extracellular solute-binding protein [Bacilli bacterium]
MKITKVLIGICFTLLLVLSAVTLRQKEALLILNWGEYINDEVVERFEKEYNINVIISLADSNELFYSKIKSGTTAYDLVIPSEYMVQKMYENGMLQPIQKDKLSNYREDIFLPGVDGIIESMSAVFPEYVDYQIPYFWGTFGLMYNKRKIGLEEIIREKGWDAFFNEAELPKGTEVGMYNVPRFAYAAAMFYNHMSPNAVPTEENISIAQRTLAMRKFSEWGTDTLKKNIQKGDLDLAFVYTGDFLDMLYQEINDEVNPKDISEIEYDIYIPDDTIAFMDSFVIPKNARHVDLAHAFINYFLDPQNAYDNASVVGYCTPLIESYNMILAGKDTDDKYLQNWAQAMEKYYPLPDETWAKPYKGTPLTNFDVNSLTKITNMVNYVKTR